MKQEEPKRSSFAKDTLKLVGGTTVAQMLGILLSPIFARIFLPEAFGLAALFSSILGTLQVIVCLRYELTIMLPQDDDEAINLFVISILSVLGISSLTAFIVFFLSDEISQWLKTPNLQYYLWLLPIALLLSGFYATLSSWVSRKQKFGSLSLSQVSNSFVALFGRLGLGLSGFTSGGVIITTTMLGSVVGTGLLANRVWKEPEPPLLDKVSGQTLRECAKRYYKFPFYNTLASFLNILSWQLPIFFLAYFFSPLVVGYYSLGNRLIRMPMLLIGTSVGQVFYQRASSLKDKDSLSRLVESALQSLVALSLFPMLILVVIGDNLFLVILGERWVEAGVYSQILAAWMFFWFISSPLSSLYNVYEKQENLLGLQLGIFVSRLVSLTIGGIWGGPRLCLIFFGISGAIVYAYLCLNILRASNVEVVYIVRLFRYYLTLFLPAGLILMAMKIMSVSPLVVVIIACLLVLIYLIYLFYTDDKIRQLVSTVGLARFAAR